MVDTIKFSEFTNAGDLEPNQTTVGLEANANARFSNPFPLLPPGTTAERPAIAASMYYRLRFNTTLEAYEYYSPTLTDWVQLQDSAPSTIGPFVTYTADTSVPNAQNIGLLTDGILKQTVVAGVSTLAIAVPNVDYLLPVAPLGTMAYQDANNVNISGGVANLTSGQVTAAPVNPTDLVNKAYADTIAGGFTFKGACVLTSTVNLSATYNNGASGVGATLTALANGIIVLDGLSPNNGERVLIRNQVSTPTNGIYVVTDRGTAGTPFILTRATDFDNAIEIQPGSIIFIQDGNTFSDTSFVETEPVFTVGTDPILFTQFSQQYPLSMGNGGTGTSLTPTVNNLVYSTASNLALLATANNGVLITSAGGVPSVSSTLPSGLSIPGYATSGANTNITSLTGLTGKLQAPTAIADSLGNNVLAFAYNATPVNYWLAGNSATGQPLGFQAIGTDTNIQANIQSKGTGQVIVIGGLGNTAPFAIYNGTAYQHGTNFLFPNTAATRNVTFQDSDGTLAYLTDRGYVLLGTATASSSAALAFTNLTGYSNLMLVFNSLQYGTNGATLLMQASINNGASWLSAAPAYYQQSLFVTAATVAAGSDITTLTSAVCSGANSSAAGNNSSGFMVFEGVNSAGGTVRKGYTGKTVYINTTPTVAAMDYWGTIPTPSAVNAIRILPNAGVFSSGTVQIYGMI